jgi:YbbR domain-containing protein
MRDWITKDFAWKLASVIFAIVIWVIVYKYREGTPEFGTHISKITYGDLSVLVISAAGDARSYHILPDKVSVTVNGPDNVMNGLQRTEIEPFVDVTGKESAGSYRADVKVSLPKGVTLVDVYPSWVGVTAPGH